MKAEYTKHPMYRGYHTMLTRCRNPKSKDYHHYGGRGITVCDRWQQHFLNFLEDMGERPTPKHTLDRINNDGNYEPSNCRWATRTMQVRNTRVRKESKSGHKGVYWIEKAKRYRAYLHVNGKMIDLGQAFKTLDEAIEARKQGEEKYYG